MRDGVEDKDSPMILEECLKDTDWMQSVKQKQQIFAALILTSLFLFFSFSNNLKKFGNLAIGVDNLIKMVDNFFNKFAKFSLFS